MSSSEHAVDRNRRRAEAVHALLEELWGDDLPPGPSPQVTALIDALVGDDHFGRLNGYLVHGDQVSYEAVTTLIRLCRTPEIIADLLGPALVDRITDSVGRSADGDIQDWTDGHLPQADTPPGEASRLLCRLHVGHGSEMESLRSA